MVDVVDNTGVIEVSKATSQQRFGELVGISQQTVSDLCRRKVLASGQSVGEWLQQYCSHLREQAAGRAASGGLDLAAERAALARAQREKIEMQNDVTRRDYGPIEALEMGLADVMARIASKLETIPGKLKMASDQLTAEDLDRVSAVLADVRNDIADMKIDWFGENDIGGDDIANDSLETDG